MVINFQSMPQRFFPHPAGKLSARDARLTAAKSADHYPAIAYRFFPISAVLW